MPKRVYFIPSCAMLLVLALVAGPVVLDFIDRAHKAGKPFFVWWNSTRMHSWTHLKKASEGKTGLGIADNTIVMYSTDNGAEAMS